MIHYLNYVQIEKIWILNQETVCWPAPLKENQDHIALHLPRENSLRFLIRKICGEVSSELAKLKKNDIVRISSLIRWF